MANPARDIIIVGAGIIGIACAHYLARAGHKVTVIDRGKIGNGSTYGNCGVICPSHILPLAEPSALAEGFKSLFNPRAPFRLKLQPRRALCSWM